MLYELFFLLLNGFYVYVMWRRTFSHMFLKRWKREKLEMSLWTEPISSSTEQVYHQRWKSFQNTYDNLCPATVQYIKDTWLVPWRKQLVRAWVDKTLHFGHRTTWHFETYIPLV